MRDDRACLHHMVDAIDAVMRYLDGVNEAEFRMDGRKLLVLDEGNGARQILAGRDLPVRSVVVGIVDDVAFESAAASHRPAAPTPGVVT